MAKMRLENSWQKHNDQTPIYLLDLISHRDVSNEIAESLEVTHQSPQLILVKNGEMIYNASHISINSKEAASYN